MLEKIVSIKNVGRFRNSATAGSRNLAKHTLVLGANGSGKSTLVAILRSLTSRDPAGIKGRHTLGAAGCSTIDLLISGNRVCFNGVEWQGSLPDITIFDNSFVSENVYSGDSVTVDHRRSLYHVILGAKGVDLIQERTRLSQKSREITGEISRAAAEIEQHKPNSIRLEAFLELPEEPNIDQQIAGQRTAVEISRRAQEIIDRPFLDPVSVPDLPAGLQALLTKTIEDIAQDAEDILAEHFRAHGFKNGGWIAEGLGHLHGEACPFCGQGIAGQPLISAYKGIFGERYKNLKNEIDDMRAAIDNKFGAEASAAIQTATERNRSACEFWDRYCEFDSSALIHPAEIWEALGLLGQAARNLLEHKDSAPLDPIELDNTYLSAETQYRAAQEKAQEINNKIDEINKLIVQRKHEAGSQNVQEAEGNLDRLTAVKLRHTLEISDLCQKYSRLKEQKKAIDIDKSEAQKRLDQYAANTIQPYEDHINDYLDSFNSGFRITETRQENPGGIPASAYRLVINDTAVQLGNNRTPNDTPSFKNTLSAGDRTTLALAFFLAHLDKDAELANKIVVFDDPFSSQDAFRRLSTVHRIHSIGERCAQAIVLSHDAQFLRQIWNKAPAATRVSLNLVDHLNEGSKIETVDLDRASQGRTAKDLDDLLTFSNKAVGHPEDVIRKIRVVLETFFWNTFPGFFAPDEDWLGDILRKIREGGEDHPAKSMYKQLNEINDYSKRYHHGERSDGAAQDVVDLKELRGYVQRTLRIVNALQA